MNGRLNIDGVWVTIYCQTGKGVTVTSDHPKIDVFVKMPPLSLYMVQLGTSTMQREMDKIEDTAVDEARRQIRTILRTKQSK